MAPTFGSNVSGTDVFVDAPERRHRVRRILLIVAVLVLVLVAAIVGLIVYHAVTTDAPPPLDFTPLTTVASK